MTEVLEVEATNGRTGVESSDSEGERNLSDGVEAGVVVPCKFISARGDRLGVKMRGAILIECLKSTKYL